MIVVMCATRNWYFYTAILIHSLLINNPQTEKIYLFIEDNNIPYITDKRVIFMNYNNFDSPIKDDSPNILKYPQWPKMNYTRLFFCRLLEEDKILYLDTDVIVNKNIQDLWDIDLGDKLFAAVEDFGARNSSLDFGKKSTKGRLFPYFNSGVLLMNLKKIKEENIDKYMIDEVNSHLLKYPDQDVLNEVGRNKTIWISSSYNCHPASCYISDPHIKHYTMNRKGWHFNREGNEIWWKYYNSFLDTLGEKIKGILAVFYTSYLLDNGDGTFKNFAPGTIVEVSRQGAEQLYLKGKIDILNIILSDGGEG